MNGEVESVEVPPSVSAFENNPFGPLSLNDSCFNCEVEGLSPEQRAIVELRYDERFNLRVSVSSSIGWIARTESLGVRVQLLSNQAISIPCMATSWSIKSDSSSRLDLLPVRQPVVIGSTIDLEYITGVISNGPELLIPLVTSGGVTKARAVHLVNERWDINIFRFSHTEQLFKNAKQNEGRYGITHWFTAKPRPTTDVSSRAIEELIISLTQLLSYVRGASVGVLHVYGYRGAEIAFVRLGSNRHDPFGEPHNWFDPFLTDQIEELFRVLSLANSDSERRLPLSRAIEYYRLGNYLQKISSESALIMTVAALETIADAVLGSEACEAIKRKPDGRLAGAVREAAKKLGVCHPPSSGLPHLESIIARYNWRDGYHAITKMRNLATHSTSKDYTGLELLEAWQAAQWLTEVMLAIWIGFRGDFSDRRAMRWVGEKTPIKSFLNPQ